MIKNLKNRKNILKIACKNLYEREKKSVIKFINENEYFIKNYALYQTIKMTQYQKPFYEWSDAELKFYNKDRIKKFEEENQDEINYYYTEQYLFFKQWGELKKYANKKGIDIIGDIPIYSAYDSDEVWSKSENFLLDENRKPKSVAGCPPDGFSALGQLWGNPLYNYEHIKQNHYEYFVNKFKFLSNVYDVIRIDHFRGFESYYSIPADAKDARVGEWKQGPSLELFEVLKKNIPNIEFIAEDLGFLTPEVHKLLVDTGFPGMKILEFAFNHYDKGNDLYLPHAYKENCVAYLGTHDNDTFRGWYEHISKEDFDYAKEYLQLKNPDEYNLEALKVLYDSKANLVITMPQDLLNMGSEARINEPSIMSDKNWTFRFLPNEIDEKAERALLQLTVESHRQSRNLFGFLKL